ncbi:MFS transporter [Salinispira pacifica]|uniref:MFS transporter n=1 Tax=Salinispira pacifica TaxID=1307761 RepID=V5WNT1_9SPIO|nr:glycoside-pentoside-hexuronide (GPH):cation symporter [Salinispira pacifica]AHC16751.1 hypothetical protein L21SP2_3413 [Salinispira pacifica]
MSEITKKEPALKHMLAYGSGDIYGGGSFFIIGALFLVFLTDVVGMKPSLAGVIILIGKIWDAVSDPAMGFLSDNTRSRWGRRRVFFLIGVLPVFLSFSLLWISVPGTPAAGFFYYLAAYLFFNSVFTMMLIPYNSLPAEMSKTYAKRSRMIAVRMVFSQLGVLLGAVAAKTLVELFPTETEGYMFMGLIFGGLYAIPWIFVFFGTYERDHSSEPPVRGFRTALVSILSEFATTMRNRSLRIHISMYLAAYLTMDIFNALFLFYLKDYLDREPLYQVLLGIVIGTQILTLYFVARSCSRIGNAPTYRRHIVIWAAGFLILGLVRPATPIPILIIPAVLIGIGLSGGAMVPYNMLAFVTDADEMITRRRREGTYAGVMTFIRKTAQALALFLVGLGLDAIGYIPASQGLDVIQSNETVSGIRWMLMSAPAVLLIFGFLISLKFSINPQNHRVLLKEIKRLKHGGRKADAEQQTRQILRDITGLHYEQLWSESGGG